MKFKKAIIFICLIVCFLTIAGVSAGDVDETLAAESDDQMIEIENQENVGVAEDESLSASTGTFTELANEIANANGELTLTKNYDYEEPSMMMNSTFPGDSFYRNGITIDKEITINGNGFTINGKNQARIFNVSHDKVVLKNINFINAYASDSYSMGSAVDWNGANGTLRGCSFIDCAISYLYSSDSYFWGGALSWSGDDGVVSDCIFESCSISAPSSSDSCSYGGALEWSGDRGLLYNCSFIDCFASSSRICGGAVSWSGEDGVLRNCSFIDCYVSYSGSSTSSEIYGGAVYWQNLYGLLTDCSFESCFASSSAPYSSSSRGTYSCGGAVFWDYNAGTMSNCTFKECYVSASTTYAYGGAVYWNEYWGSLSGCNFTDCYIESLDAYTYDGGGAVFWNYAHGDLSNCRFINNSAELGGAVYFDENDCTLYNCSFVDCSASRYAGAVYWIGTRGILVDCSFVDCSAVNGGGAVHWRNYDGTLGGCNFIGCSANEGGAVYWYGSRGVLFFSSFVDCSAGNEGGAVYWDGSKGNLNNSTFVNCNSSEYKAVYGITCEDCKFMEKPFVSISSPTVKYGQNAKVTVNLASDVPGNVRFTVNGVTEKVKITNGKATYTVSGLKVGTYDVKVAYAGNYKYIADTISTSIKVNKNNPIVSSKANDCSYGTNAIITVNLAQNVPGNVRITVNGVQYVCKINDCVASASIPGLRVGSYPVTISYAGNVNYNAQTIQKTLNVVKGTPIISVSAPDAAYGKNAKITVNLASDVPGNVWFTINGVSEKVKITNAKATYTVSGLKTGSYEVTVRYGGNVNYNAQTIKKTLNIVKANPITSVSVGSINVGDTAIVTVNFQNNVNGFVKITVNGVTERVQIVNGVASASFSNLKAGTYDVSAVFAGGTNYNAQTATASFEVSKSSPGLTVVKRTVEGKTVLIASIAEDATGYVNFAVNGGTYKAKIVNGEATLTLPDFAPGTYTLKSSYGGNYKYLAETKTRTITIK